VQALVWSTRRDIYNPAVEALPVWAGTREIMQSGAFLGDQPCRHNRILYHSFDFREENSIIPELLP